jgi:Fe-S oxidoreductase
MTLSEFLYEYLEGYQPPKLERKAVLHGHCHHKAVMNYRSEAKLLNQMCLDLEDLDSGCCGMAGAFGFEKEKVDVSLAVGERVLLPRVREVDPGTLIIANGFSCREQISQETERKALHLAQVLEMAYSDGEA